MRDSAKLLVKSTSRVVWTECLLSARATHPITWQSDDNIPLRKPVSTRSIPLFIIHPPQVILITILFVQSQLAPHTLDVLQRNVVDGHCGLLFICQPWTAAGFNHLSHTVEVVDMKRSRSVRRNRHLMYTATLQPTASSGGKLHLKGDNYNRICRAYNFIQDSLKREDGDRRVKCVPISTLGDHSIWEMWCLCFSRTPRFGPYLGGDYYFAGVF